MGLKDKIKNIVGAIKEEKEVLIGEKSKDSQFSSLNSFPTEEIAKREFISAVERLFDVNSWSQIPAIANSSFQIYDEQGIPIKEKKVQLNNLIKIDLAGLLPDNWVKVIELKEGEDLAEFIVAPTSDPTSEYTKTDHFFTNEARSIFRVEQKGNEIKATEIGQDEVINNQDPEAGKRSIINTFIAEGGWAGFQKYQWKNLTDYLVNKNNE